MPKTTGHLVTLPGFRGDGTLRVQFNQRPRVQCDRWLITRFHNGAVVRDAVGRGTRLYRLPTRQRGPG